MIIYWTCRHLTFPTNSTSLQNMAFSKYILYILKTCRSKVKWSNYSNITKINKQYQILAEFLLYFAAKLKMNINFRWFFKSQLHTFYILQFIFIKTKEKKRKLIFTFCLFRWITVRKIATLCTSVYRYKKKDEGLFNASFLSY